MATTMKRTVTGALVSCLGAAATLWLSVVGFGAATANADIVYDPVGHGTWCPGDPIWWQVQGLAANWDPNVCHEVHQTPAGWAEGPLPAGTFVCPPLAFMCP